MTLNVTEQEARELKERAIQRAIDLDILGKAKYLLDADPSSVDDQVRKRTLPGSGVMISGRFRSDLWFSINIYLATNKTVSVFLASHPARGSVIISAFREGSWTKQLQGEYEAVKYRKENKGVVEILDKFAPMENLYR